MFVNIGANTIIKKKDIVAVFDIETTTGSETTREYLRRSNKRSEIVTLTEDLPRAMVLCNSRNGMALYITDVSSAAIKRRMADNHSGI